MDKKGVSIMIGYVLLITAAIVMGAIVYQWLRTYVPIEAPACSDEISVFMKRYSCDPATGELTITIKNNGKFNLAGYFIHVSTDPTQEIATIDLSEYVTTGGISAGGSLIFSAGSTNSLRPNKEFVSVFDLNGDVLDGGSGLVQIYLIEIIPVRFQEIRNKLTFISCGNAKIREPIDDSTCIFTDLDD